MNAYFDHHERIDTNSRIIEAYFSDVTTAPGVFSRGIDAVLTFLFAMWKALTSDVARRVVKALGVAISLVGLCGVIGAIERGTLGLGAGLVIGLAIVGIEYLCLRPRHS
jgi:hypothetical protein